MWETPCSDNYIDCGDCLKKQRSGMNIACPEDCNLDHYFLNIPTPISTSLCPDVMCDLYCENGNQKDSNGCDICSCNNPMPSIAPPIAIDPMPPTAIDPMPPILTDNTNNLLNSICSVLQEAVIHKCDSNCQNCDFADTRELLNNCLDENGNNAYDSICSSDDNSDCPIEYIPCDSEYVCPKITEVTQCGDGGIDGYTTYRLSLVIKNDNVKNIYAVYGSDSDNIMKPLDFPPAYQGSSIFNNNIGGIPPTLISINSDSQFDSWLTIGLTNGDPLNKLSTIGIDFNSWTIDDGINTINGAVFQMNPEERIINTNECIIAQLTIPNTLSYEVKVNVQGKKKISDSSIASDSSWNQENIIFNISPPNRIIQTTIPNNCKIWYDGCNRCQVNNGVLGSCTRMMCFTEDNPRCLSFNTNGH
jgi:hypothetical protein